MSILSLNLDLLRKIYQDISLSNSIKFFYIKAIHSGSLFFVLSLSEVCILACLKIYKMSEDLIIIVFGAIFSVVMIGIAFIINGKAQPKQLWMLFFTEMWERFLFMGCEPCLYCT